MDRWRSLTKLPEKADAYTADPLTRTAMAIAGDVTADLPDQLWDLALIVVKPEALVSGRLRAVERFLTANSLSVVSSFDVELDAARSAVLWSYPWVKATTDRIRLHIMLSEGEPSRCLLVRRDVRGDVPLTMWLAERKGSSKEHLRTPGQLRTELGMSNRMISFVHCPDEPADLLRDIYVLGGAPGVELLTTPPSSWTEDETWTSGTPTEAVDLELSSLLGELTGWGRDQLTARLAARRERNETAGLADALHDVRKWGAHGRWVEHPLAAELIPHDLPGVTVLFDRLTVTQLAGRWRDPTGR